MNRTSFIAGTVISLGLFLAACGSNPPATTPTTNSNVSTTTLSSTKSSSSTTSTSMASSISAAHNTADVMFAQMMILHHQGAIEMAGLAPERASSQAVKDLAAKIKQAQTPEIELMTAWLPAWGSAMTTSSSSSGMGMDNGAMSGSSMATTSMPGMMTDQQMTALKAASGTAFDKMFLQLMITHHQGALDMANVELANGSNPDAVALAASIKTSQTAEIATMQHLLQTL